MFSDSNGEEIEVLGHEKGGAFSLILHKHLWFYLIEPQGQCQGI